MVSLVCMEWLNYHHLLYFWTVAREGTITRAGEKLLLAQSTISGQIRSLERRKTRLSLCGRNLWPRPGFMRNVSRPIGRADIASRRRCRRRVAALDRLSAVGACAPDVRNCPVNLS